MFDYDMKRFTIIRGEIVLTRFYYRFGIRGFWLGEN